MIQPKYLTAIEVAALTRVSRRTVERWVQGGEVVSIKIGGRRLFPAGQFEAGEVVSPAVPVPTTTARQEREMAEALAADHGIEIEV